MPPAPSAARARRGQQTQGSPRLASKAATNFWALATPELSPTKLLPLKQDPRSPGSIRLGNSR